MVKVTFTSHNKEIYCNKGDKLLDVARNADIFIDAPCNGNVSCGKCKVRLIKGKVDTEKTHHIKDEEWNQGYILACNTKVIEDIDIEVPSKLSSSMYGMKIEGSDNRKDKEVFDRAKKIIKENNVEKVFITLHNSESFKLVKDNVAEIKNHLNNLDINVNEVNVEMKSENRDDFSQNLNQQFNKGNNKQQRRAVKFEIENESSIENDLLKTDSNINRLI